MTTSRGPPSVVAGPITMLLEPIPEPKMEYCQNGRCVALEGVCQEKLLHPATDAAAFVGCEFGHGILVFDEPSTEPSTSTCGWRGGTCGLTSGGASAPNNC